MIVVTLFGTLFGFVGVTLAWMQKRHSKTEAKKQADLREVFKEQMRSIIRAVDNIRDRGVGTASSFATNAVTSEWSTEDKERYIAQMPAHMWNIDDSLTQLRYSLDAIWTGHLGANKPLPTPPEIRQLVRARQTAEASGQTKVPNASTKDPSDTNPT